LAPLDRVELDRFRNLKKNSNDIFSFKNNPLLETVINWRLSESQISSFYIVQDNFCLVKSRVAFENMLKDLENYDEIAVDYESSIYDYKFHG